MNRLYRKLLITVIQFLSVRIVNLWNILELWIKSSFDVIVLWIICSDYRNMWR